MQFLKIVIERRSCTAAAEQLLRVLCDQIAARQKDYGQRDKDYGQRDEDDERNSVAHRTKRFPTPLVQIEPAILCFTEHGMLHQ
jgi:hypothetical protein